MTAAFAPGDLVQARGREWVSLPTSLPGLLCLRPLTGSEADIQLLDPALEIEPVAPARFDLPKLDDLATQDAGRLLAEALRLSLRRGAGPFRSASRVAFEPRAYQLVPLLMALRLPTVRLMVADAPGRWCLRCTGLINARRLAFESLTGPERKRRIAQGYSDDLL